ncbi:glycosyltransferase [Flagellimonas aequoris]|uniref:Glycosyltransferase n=1 Tax=Flagellimonas aequoris TaxID=2306997 RepID=A0A418N4P0_9FLAO|nr:glycosyltransferase [Allomuricauda aequoris]RIV68753.1 glycosyltransferase [Allomuricauda aequoris]TXK00452.1 glycosyltransferase family 4 protein [Allomuricauda aequoris]
MTKKLLVIGHVWPEPNTTAAGGRMLQLLEAFLSFGYQVSFACTASKTEYSKSLSEIGVKEEFIQLNHPSFDAFIENLNPDLVLFDRFMVEEQFGWRVVEFAPQAIRILNTEDLHSLRKAREEAIKDEVEFNIGQWKTHPLTLREVASIYRCDVSLMVSTFEMGILQEQLQVPQGLLLHLPLMLEVPTAKNIKEWPSFDERQHFITVGNGKHAPNVDAIKILKKEIWPLIRNQLPNAEIHIYGAYLPQMIQEMHAPKQGFHIKDWVENLDEALQNSRVLLAPIQFGAGIKGKLLEAMKNGTPSVTTSIGAEGMHGDLPWNGAISDEWDTFAHAVVELYQQRKLWEQAQHNGINLLHTYFDKEKLHDRLARSIVKIGENLDAHREQNFIGRLLQHQTLNSTKYMAKWIEAKNGHQG